ncbi:MAG: InlB B-repeat-containing protein [Blautia coccoides]
MPGRKHQKTGYEFGGWYDNPELTGKAVTGLDTEIMRNVVLYARWINGIIDDILMKYLGAILYPEAKSEVL